MTVHLARSMLLRLRERCCGAPRVTPEQQLIHLALIIRKDEIQEHSNNGGDDEWSLYNQIETLLEALQMHVRTTVVENLVEPSGSDNIDKANAESNGQDESIASRELDHSQNSDSSNYNCAVEEDLHPTKY